MEESESRAFRNYMDELDIVLKSPTRTKEDEFERHLDDYASKGGFNRGGLKPLVI